MIRALAPFFAFLTMSIPAAAQQAESMNCLRGLLLRASDDATASAKFDPERLLVSKGVDPNKLSFEFERRDAGLEARLGPLGTFSVKHDGKPVLTIEIRRDSPRATRVFPQIWSIAPEFKDKGVGSVSYAAVAKMLFDDYGFILKSDDALEVSNKAVAVWNRFVHQGLASRGSERARAFKKDALAGEQFQAVADFLRPRLTIRTTTLEGYLKSYYGIPAEYEKYFALIKASNPHAFSQWVDYGFIREVMYQKPGDFDYNFMVRRLKNYPELLKAHKAILKDRALGLLPTLE